MPVVSIEIEKISVIKFWNCPIFAETDIVDKIVNFWTVLNYQFAISCYLQIFKLFASSQYFGFLDIFFSEAEFYSFKQWLSLAKAV